MKKFLVMSFTFIMVMGGFSTTSFAAEYLGGYDLGRLDQYHSSSCEATDSSLKFKVYNFDEGTAIAVVDEKAPGGSWSQYSNYNMHVSPNSSKYYEVNAKAGYDYRIQISTDVFTSSASGSTYCYP